MIVCGTDLSERSRPAQLAAVAMGQLLDETEICLTYVLDLPVAVLPERLLREAEAASVETLESHAEELRKISAVPVRTKVIGLGERVPHVRVMLVDFAESEGASLLVVSSQGHGSSPLFRLGGTSERVAHVTRVPTLVVRDAKPFVDWATQGRPLRVVLGVDETQTSDAAILWTKQLLARAAVNLTVAHVYYVNDAVRRYGIHRKIAQTEEDPELETLIERDMAQRFGAEVPEGRATFCAKLGLGRLGDHLLSVADSAAADLIVVGTHQGRGLSRLSSVSSVVLHYGHASVACIPQREHAKLERIVRFKRVLVPTDLSTEGNYAALHGYSLCGEGGDVHLMHVAPEAELQTRSDSELARELRALVPKDSGTSVTRTIVLRRGDVARAICETADRLGVDAICLAASTKSRLDKTLLGSVASEVARQASQPIMLVRAPAP